jgi:hypothetical protein
MDFTIADDRGMASAGTVNTGNPERDAPDCDVAAERPFLAKSERTAPADEAVAPAISFTAAKTASSISSVVLIDTS